MTTTTEQLQTTYKELSKFITALFLIIVAISCYLLQRSYVTIFLAEYVDTEFADTTFQNQQQPQVSFGALKFQYGAMNIFWPLVILVLLLVLKFLLKKQTSIWTSIKANDNAACLNFDSMNVYEQILSDKSGRRILNIAAYLPLIALFAHLLAGGWLFFILSSDQIANSDAADILIPETFLQIFISIFSIILIVGIPRFVIRTVRSYLKT